MVTIHARFIIIYDYAIDGSFTQIGLPGYEGVGRPHAYLP